MFSRGKKRNRIWYLWKYLEGLWSPNVKGNGWRKEGVVNIYSLISQSLWTRSSDDLTCGAAFTEDVVHTVCLLLDTRKGTFLQLFYFLFFLWIAQRKKRGISSVSFPSVTKKFSPPEMPSVLPTDQLADPLQWSATHSFTGSWQISGSERRITASAPNCQAGQDWTAQAPVPLELKKEQVRLWCWQLPLACESLWRLMAGETQNHWHSSNQKYSGHLHRESG